MNKTQKIRLGIIGPGNHAQENLLPALLSLEGIELYAVQSRDKRRAQDLARRYAMPRTYVGEDTVQLFKDNDCDGIIVSATPQVHQKLLLQAIQEGKNIFVEKPPAVDLDSLNEIRQSWEVATQRPVVQFGFNFRHSEFYRQIEDMNDKKPIRYMKIKSYAAKPDVPMWQYNDVVESSLYAIHIHALEMLCFTLGTLIDFEHKLTWLDNSKFVLTVVASFVDGKMGLLELSNASNRFEFDVECMDSNKNVFRCNGFNHMEIFGAGFDTADSFKPKSFVAYDVPFLRGGFDRTGYSRQFEVFRDSIVSRKPNPATFTSCIDAYKIIDGVMKNER